MKSLAKRIMNLIKRMPPQLWVQIEDETAPTLDAYLWVLTHLGGQIELQEVSYAGAVQRAIIRVRVMLVDLVVEATASATESEAAGLEISDAVSLAYTRAVRNALRRILRPFFHAIKPDARRALLATAHIIERNACLSREHRNEILSREMGKPVQSLKDLDLDELAHAVSILSVYAQPSEPSSQYEEVARD